MLSWQWRTLPNIAITVRFLWLTSLRDRKFRCPTLSNCSRVSGAAALSGLFGPGGGYLLAHKLDETRISDIILSADEPLTATRCKPNTSKGCLSDGTRCLTHDLWEELGHQIQAYLSSVTLEDVMERRVRRSAPFDLSVGNPVVPQQDRDKMGQKTPTFDVAD